MNSIQVDHGGFGEFPEWDLVIDARVVCDGILLPCPHVIADEAGNWIVPRAAKTWNEGGYGSTMICIDCIIEQVAKLEDNK